MARRMLTAALASSKLPGRGGERVSGGALLGACAAGSAERPSEPSGRASSGTAAPTDPEDVPDSIFAGLAGWAASARGCLCAACPDGRADALINSAKVGSGAGTGLAGEGVFFGRIACHLAQSQTAAATARTSPKPIQTSFGTNAMTTRIATIQPPAVCFLLAMWPPAFGASFWGIVARQPHVRRA